MNEPSSPTAEGAVGKDTYAGLFLVTLSTLVYEILLTRIFSVTMWYHYAFMAVSIALFGMTVGAILVYLFPQYFTQERTKHHLAFSAWLFGATTLFSFLTYASIPFVTGRSLVAVYSFALTYAIISVPFVFSGVCVSLALTRFPRHVSRLYATDLAGAAVGCILIIYILRITDGPGAVIVVALLASIGAVFFTAGEGARGLRRAALASTVLLALFAGAHAVSVAKQDAFFRLLWVGGHLEDRALFEKWNSFSRIRVFGDPDVPQEPFGWGLSPRSPADPKARQLWLHIDERAGTVLTGFSGDMRRLEYLKYDISNLAHYLRRGAHVLVIGSGGGRDILSALAFGQKSVLAVEINKDIIAGVNQRFGDFTGHLDRHPGVTFVNDEARSYIARQRVGFDIIQASLIDTWAATAAGAFVLSENSLYTVQAWKLFLERLTPNGLLTFSRWYSQGRPAEMYRLTALASAALKQSGVENPRDHIIIARILPNGLRVDGRDGVGTMLLSKQPFSEGDLRTIEGVAERMQFDLVLTPRVSLDPTLASLAAGKNLAVATAKFPLNIAPPTDDSPFFFNMLRPRDILKPSLWTQTEQANLSQAQNLKAVSVLGILFFVVLAMTLACIIVPLALTTRPGALEGAGPLFLFFASIGLGFMFVEISQMQRLIVFLGHPTYGLTVVLFALLLSTGLGSQLTQSVSNHRFMAAAMWRFGILLCTLVVFGTLTPYAIGVFQGATTPLRILVAMAILFPLGIFMGMAFPLGMKMATTNFRPITPWLWGINGATSVCGSVAAIVVALNAGISASFWTGVAWYVAAAGAFLLAHRESAAATRDALSPQGDRQTNLA